MTRVVVLYDHQERDTQIIFLAVTSRNRPTENEWRPAFRDVINGQRVVWARFPTTSGAVWLRDRQGIRQTGMIGSPELPQSEKQSLFKRTIKKSLEQSETK
jgi:hypothetical protein